jgi:signal transduction histidine kinase
MLPDGRGDELVRRARASESTRAVPFVFVSALGSVDDRVRGLEAGADDYVAKPFDPGELRARVASALRRRIAEQRALGEQRDELEAELHDGVCGLLARAAVLLDAHQRDAGPSMRVASARAAVQDALVEARALLTLADREEEPWDAFVREIGDAFERAATGAGLTARFSAPSEQDRRLPAQLAHVLRRAAHEGTTNVLRHSGARAVALSLELVESARRVRLQLEDDGEGLENRATDRRGLTTMQRRVARAGGTLEIGGGISGGTRLTLELPLERSDSAWQ